MGWLGDIVGAAAPLAGYAIGSSFGMPVLGGALGGAISGKLRGDQARDIQARTANASADAIASSWARKGAQHIPQIQWASGTPIGEALQGGVAGALQGGMFKQGGEDSLGEGWLQRLFAAENTKPHIYSRRQGSYPIPE